MSGYLSEVFLDFSDMENGVYHGNITIDLETGEQEQTMHKGEKKDCKEQSCMDEEE